MPDDRDDSARHEPRCSRGLTGTGDIDDASATAGLDSLAGAACAGLELADTVATVDDFDGDVNREPWTVWSPAVLGRVGIWSGVLDAVPSAEAQRLAAMLEELGFTALWIPEAVGRDPFVMAALLLSATSDLTVATGIANIYARDAVTMANTQRTLEEAFPSRFLLGLGVSHHHLVDRVRHHDYSKPYSRMVQYLDDMDAAVFRAVGPAERPATVLAALGPKMLRLAADRADGAHPYFVTVEHTAQAREILGPDRILAPEQMVVLETDRVRALTIARKGMAVYLRAPNYVNNLKRLGFDDDDFVDGGSDRLVDAIVACGDVEAARARVRSHFDAGASHVCVQVLTDDATAVPRGEWADLAEALADERG